MYNVGFGGFWEDVSLQIWWSLTFYILVLSLVFVDREYFDVASKMCRLYHFSTKPNSSWTIGCMVDRSESLPHLLNVKKWRSPATWGTKYTKRFKRCIRKDCLVVPSHKDKLECQQNLFVEFTVDAKLLWKSYTFTCFCTFSDSTLI